MLPGHLGGFNFLVGVGFGRSGGGAGDVTGIREGTQWVGKRFSEKKKPAGINRLPAG